MATQAGFDWASIKNNINRESRAEIAQRMFDEAYSRCTTLLELMTVVNDKDIQPYAEEIRLHIVPKTAHKVEVVGPKPQRLRGEALQHEEEAVGNMIKKALRDLKATQPATIIRKPELMVWLEKHHPEDVEKVEKRWNSVTTALKKKKEIVQVGEKTKAGLWVKV